MSDFWTHYWKQGHVTSFGDSQGLGYQGKLANYWLTTLTNLLMPNDILLDIGCGNGAIFDVVMRSPSIKNVQMRGVDAAKLSVPKKFKLPNISFFEHTHAESLPFEDNSIKCATSQFGIEYSDLSQSIPELKRVLISGGKVIFIVHLKTSSIVAPNTRILSMARRVEDRKSGLLSLLKETVEAIDKGVGAAKKKEYFDSAFRSAYSEDSLSLRATNFPQFCNVLFQPNRNYQNRLTLIKMFEDELVGQVERLSDLYNAALSDEDIQSLISLLNRHGFHNVQNDVFVDDDGQCIGARIAADVQ